LEFPGMGAASSGTRARVAGIPSTLPRAVSRPLHALGRDTFLRPKKAPGQLSPGLVGVIMLLTMCWLVAVRQALTCVGRGNEIKIQHRDTTSLALCGVAAQAAAWAPTPFPTTAWGHSPTPTNINKTLLSHSSGTFHSLKVVQGLRRATQM